MASKVAVVSCKVYSSCTNVVVAAKAMFSRNVYPWQRDSSSSYVAFPVVWFHFQPHFPVMFRVVSPFVIYESARDLVVLCTKPSFQIIFIITSHLNPTIPTPTPGPHPHPRHGRGNITSFISLCYPGGWDEHSLSLLHSLIFRRLEVV